MLRFSIGIFNGFLLQKSELIAVFIDVISAKLIIDANPKFIYPMAQQWIFAGKGITLFINDFKSKNPDNSYPEGYIEAVAFYSCTTSEYYRTMLGAQDYKHRKSFRK